MSSPWYLALSTTTDHAGNGKAIQEELALPVYAPEKCIPLLKSRSRTSLLKILI